MNTTILKTNSAYDKVYEETNKKVSCLSTPEYFPMIYDFAKRYANQYGVGIQLIEKVYLLGYVYGAERCPRQRECEL